MATVLPFCGLQILWEDEEWKRTYHMGLFEKKEKKRTYGTLLLCGFFFSFLKIRYAVSVWVARWASWPRSVFIVFFNTSPSKLIFFLYDTNVSMWPVLRSIREGKILTSLNYSLSPGSQKKNHGASRFSLDLWATIGGAISSSAKKKKSSSSISTIT